MKDKNKKIKLSICFSLLFVVLIVGIFAFMSAKDEKTNTFTVGNIKIELWEDFDSDGDNVTEVYNADYQQIEMSNEFNVIPRRVVQHAPYIKNVGKNDAYLFMVAAVPVHEVVMQGDTYLTLQQLFYLQDELGNNVLGRNKDEQQEIKWAYMGKFDSPPWQFDEGQDNTGDDYIYYLFKYLDISHPGDTTNNLFEQTYTIDYTNFTTGSEVNNKGINIGENSYIKVYAFGIQEEGFNSADAAWSTVCPYMHEISFNLGEDVPELSPAFFIEGSTINITDTPKRNHYYVSDWTFADAEGNSYTGTTMPSYDLIATPVWTPMPKIIFDTDGGSEVEAIEQAAGTNVNKVPKNPTKVGYTFAGWSSEIPDIMPSQDLTLTAQWRVNQYTITFNTNGGSSVPSITQNYGTPVISPANPTKIGYTFAGWDTAIPETMPANNLQILALWNINSYNITLNFDNGDEPVVLTRTYGSSLSDINLNGFVPYTESVISGPYPETPHPYSNSMNVDYRENFGTISAPSNTDIIIKFSGDTNLESGYDYINIFNVNDNVNPVWTSKSKSIANTEVTLQGGNTYYMTFRSDSSVTYWGFSIDYIVSREYGELTKDGYTFAGWSGTLPSTMPANDITLTAQWTPN